MRAGDKKAVLFLCPAAIDYSMKKAAALLMTGAALLVLILFSAEAAEGARHGLDVCAVSLIPSLFPFFVLSNLLSVLGLPAAEFPVNAYSDDIREQFSDDAAKDTDNCCGNTEGVEVDAIDDVTKIEFDAVDNRNNDKGR